MNTLLGQRIREQRKEKGWTIEQFAERVDLSANYVGDLERGVKIPKLETFIRIVEVLDVSADVLIRDSVASASHVADDELCKKLSQLTPGQKKAAIDISKINAAFLTGQQIDRIHVQQLLSFIFGYAQTTQRLLLYHGLPPKDHCFFDQRYAQKFSILKSPDWR